MSRRFKTVLMMLAILLQVTVSAHFMPLGVIPNFVFTAVTAISIICIEPESTVFACASGLVLDMLSGAPLGLNGIMLMYFSIGCAFVSNFIYNKSVKMTVPVCFLSSFLYEGIFGAISAVLRECEFNATTVAGKALTIALVNSIVFIPLYVILGRIKPEKKRRGIKYEQ